VTALASSTCSKRPLRMRNARPPSLTVTRSIKVPVHDTSPSLACQRCREACWRL
jgi:hypothetical protein